MHKSQAPHITPLLVGVEEAARILGVSKRTLYHLIAEGSLPSVRIRGRRLLRLETLAEWVKTREFRSESATPTRERQP